MTGGSCKMCGVSGPGLKRGMCDKHYQRWLSRTPRVEREPIPRQKDQECSVPGCDGRQGTKGARGLCSKHYQRLLLTGSPAGTLRVPEETRFNSFVVRTANGCWLWNGSRDQSGYGMFSSGGHSMRAHIWAYRNYVGPIDPGNQIDHLCRKRSCVNPSHLEQVSPRENSLRGDTFCAVNAAKTHCPRGHEYSPDNTYRNPAGSRICRKCMEIHRENYEARKGVVTHVR